MMRLAVGGSTQRSGEADANATPIRKGNRENDIVHNR
jgi:hypothetical protein